MDRSFLLDVHKSIGNLPFLFVASVVVGVFCFQLIPYTTNLMTNSAAGLSQVYLGAKWRTMVINATTNIPELFLMLIALIGFRKVGGIATPLGSNLANIYLMFLLAPVWVGLKWLIQGKGQRLNQLLALLKQEKILLIWHLLVSLSLLLFSVVACWLITGNFPLALGGIGESLVVRTETWLLIGILPCLAGILLFFLFEARLKKNRPELLENLEDDKFDSSWTNFLLGTFGVILCCSILNSLFVTLSELYSSTLSRLFGTAIFVGLHFFVGSLISSLPEIIVSIENYERVKPSELNTAFSAASVSNMTNLVIAALGSFLAYLFLQIGYL